jgi:hypothetical protein
MKRVIFFALGLLAVSLTGGATTPNGCVAYTGDGICVDNDTAVNDQSAVIGDW